MLGSGDATRIITRAGTADLIAKVLFEDRLLDPPSLNRGGSDEDLRCHMFIEMRGQHEAGEDKAIHCGEAVLAAGTARFSIWEN